MQELIDDIMDSFDFDKVHKVMEFLDWKWANNLKIEEIPEIYEIRKFARNLLKECIAEKTVIESGGFRASYENKILRLDFVVEEYESY